MKKVLKYSLRTIGLIFGFILIYLLFAIFFPLITVNNNQPENIEEPIDIYILTNGIHTDIVVPVKNKEVDWSEIIPFSDTKSKQEKDLIAFGWGDKGFYLDTKDWSDLKASTALKAAFWLGSSAMHTHFYNKLVEDEDCKKITISQDDYKSLVAYIKKSFVYDANGKTELINTDMIYGNNDAFYEAKGSYNLFFTCNSWANDALKSANQRAPLWTVTQQGIFNQYKDK